jgi:ATP-binding cassette, subfamily B, bacterial
MTTGALIRRFLPFLRPYAGHAAFVLVGVVAELAFYILLPLSFVYLVDHAIVPRDVRLLARVLTGLCLLFVLAAAAALWKDRLSARIGAGVVNDLRLRLFEHLHEVPLGFFLRTPSGDILARFSSDVAAVEAALAKAVPNAIHGGVQLLACAAVLVWLDWRLTLITLAVFPLTLVGPRWLGPRAAQAGYDRKGDEGRVGSLVQESLDAQLVVRALGLGEATRARFRAALEALAASSVRAGTAGSLAGRATEAAMNLVQLVAIGAGAVLAFQGQLTVGTLIAFIGTFFNLGFATYRLSEALPPVLQAVGGLRRVAELLDEPQGVADRPGAAAVPRLAREIRFEDVSFAYSRERPILEHATLTIPAGAFVAIVGPSGSGKSTVLNLIARFYDPDEGAVLFDGRDIREVSQASLREQMGAVFQDTVLFDATIRENIRMGRPGASDADVEAAARAAEIHDFVAGLPDGYDTAVGARGGRLSGGQRQRLGLARAFLRDPAILVLDEATSALDPAAESAIQATLAGLRRGRTAVSVTHRLAQAATADLIYVLDRGRVVEHGTHDQLLARGGLYAQLWERQSGLSLSDDGRKAEVKAARLGRVAVFAGLDDSALALLASRFESERVPPGRLVFDEGDPGDKLYLIARGRVEILQRDREETLRRVVVLEDGDCFGEVALLEDVPRTAAVRALDPCHLLTLGRMQFQAALGSAPGLRALFERGRAERMQGATAASLPGTAPA